MPMSYGPEKSESMNRDWEQRNPLLSLLLSPCRDRNLIAGGDRGGSGRIVGDPENMLS